MKEIASCAIGKCFAACVSDYMKGEIHRCYATAASNSVAIKHEQLITDFNVWMQFAERVQMLVMHSCASPGQKAESRKYEGACVERSDCDPGTRPTPQYRVKHR